MKKYLVAITILAIFAGAIYAADSSSIADKNYTSIPVRVPGAVMLTGKAPRTFQIAVSNAASSISDMVVTAGGTYKGGADNTVSPIAATLSCESTATMWAFQTTPTTTVGHKVPADGSWQPAGLDALYYLKGISTTADNVSCAVTLWY